jgi:quercetin dioxygenase-like cupin family protein
VSDTSDVIDARQPTPAGPFRRFAEVPWVDEVALGRVPPELAASAAAAGALRKFVTRGEVGLYVQYSTMPAGFRVAPHSHSQGEVLYVLRGGCVVEPAAVTLGPDDSAVVPAGEEYGFTCGPDGMDFLTIRAGDATFTPAP